MARTNSQYFEAIKNLAGITSTPAPVKVLIANSTTLKLGQMARINTSGYAVAADTSHAVLGKILGFIDNNGTPVDAFMYDTTRTGHTNVGGSGINDKITTASDNQTRTTAVFAEVEPALPFNVYYNKANGALAQANLGQFFNLVSTGDQVDQASASETSGQLQLVELDPKGEGDTTAGAFRVVMSQLASYLSNATAVRVA